MCMQGEVFVVELVLLNVVFCLSDLLEIILVVLFFYY